MDYNTYMNSIRWNGGYGTRRNERNIDWGNMAKGYAAGTAAAQQQAQQWQDEGWVNPSTLDQNQRQPEGSVWNGALGQYVMPGTPEYSYQSPTGNIAGVQTAGQQTGTQQPQVMPGTAGSMYGQSGGMMSPTTGTQYTPPSYDPNSVTAQNPFLNLGLNAFTNTQGPYDPTWLNNFGQSLWNQANQNWSDNINPSLNNNAILAGGYGGDRAAIAKGVAADRLNQSVFNALAPAALQDYNSWQNRALQGGQSAASVGSGLEQLDLSRMLGIGGLQNAGRALDISQQNANTSTAAQAAASAGVPTYTNPLSAGLGGALGIAQLLNLIYGNR